MQPYVFNCFNSKKSQVATEKLNIKLQIDWANISPYFGTYFFGKYRGHVPVIYKQTRNYFIVSVHVHRKYST